ncbi:neural cell adhesion molecule 2 isoform X2 [Triplophysa dalaica]|uniref:neural cell adhesion molecule 2 isoform X2 n=1 Tax=Triplophysa dalaica TaxID=1582913 RepID=UPI0024DFC3F7|nr:neural cell adhesion molecule 2 isoform X2 [Triplophysa dalaica]
MAIQRLCGLLLLCFTFIDAKVNIIASDPDVVVESNVLLLCKAEAEGEISWFKDDEELDENHHPIEKEDESSSKLKLTNIQLTDSGVYTCKIETDQGTRSSQYTIYVYQAINFGTTRTYHEFLVNQTVIIPCVVSGKPEVEVQWYRNDRIINNDGRGQLKVLPDRSLQIVGIQQEDRGTYICVGRIKGRPINKTLPISVVVNEPPTVLIHKEKMNVFAGPNNSVSIICLVKGQPTPNIAWTTPSTSDKSRYNYNSDKSELTISGVTRSDFGEYICTATNKIGDNSATLILDVSERPTVLLDPSRLTIIPGENGSVLCNATGHPTPTTQWVKKTNQVKMTSVRGSELILTNVTPSDGGFYSCIASNKAGTTTEDFQLITWPGMPTEFSVAPGPSSSVLIQRVKVQDGGTPITHYIIQWKKPSQDDWTQVDVKSSDPLMIEGLDPYTEYSFRFAAKNAFYQGNFSTEQKIFTQSHREPSTPVLSLSEKKSEKNSVSIPIKQINDEGSPTLHYVVRYKVNKENEDWTEKQIPGNLSQIHLHNLKYNSDYQMEVFAVNHNGSSSSAHVNFTIPQPVSQPSLGKGGVVGIVMFIFLLLMLSVDAFCCYTKHCGLLNFIARKLFGHKESESKAMDEEANNGDVKLSGLEHPRGSIPKLQAPKGAVNGLHSEVTCDKAPLTKFEKKPDITDPATEA